MVDEADDVEAAGHDAGVGEALAHRGAAGGGQIDADQFDLLLALQALETGVEAGLRAAGHDVEDLVRARVAQRGGVAEAAREEALVQAEVFRTADRLPLGRLAAESVLEVALDGGRADSLPPRQPAAVDAVQMLLEDGPVEGFAGPLPGQEAGQRLAEVPPAGQTLSLGPLRLQLAMAPAPVLVPHRSPHPSPAPQQGPAAMRTRPRAHIPGANPHSARRPFDRDDLIAGQA
ncbi:MAG: hypothetical protein KatS3mg005_4000 [Bryobacteraceae bacterium]|nr:MAG: hypothetical protein KatS3mg005_4000 [Bryobacteraceae bacterium]